MERKKATDFPKEVLTLFDRYVHGGITRREFFDGVSRFAVGGLTAAAIFEALKPNYAFGQEVPPNDSSIRAEYVDYPSPQGSGTMRGYLVRPANAAGRLPAVVVIHENRGLNPYIEDVARRLAAANFLAIAPDALAPVGGYPGDDERGGQMFAQLDAAKRTEDLVAAGTFIKSHPESTGRFGVVGFCFGGGMAGTFAVRFPDLGAAVPFYGGQPAAADVPKIKSPMLIHYAANDERINAGWPAFETALKAAGVPHEMHMYPGTQHGFHNYSTPRYDEAAAKLAWQRTVDFFNEHLR